MIVKVICILVMELMNPIMRLFCNPNFMNSTWLFPQLEEMSEILIVMLKKYTFMSTNYSGDCESCSYVSKRDLCINNLFMVKMMTLIVHVLGEQLSATLNTLLFLKGSVCLFLLPLPYRCEVTSYFMCSESLEEKL